MGQVIAAVALGVAAVVIVAFVAYRVTRRDPPGYYDAKPPNPGFRSSRGRGR